MRKTDVENLRPPDKGLLQFSAVLFFKMEGLSYRTNFLDYIKQSPSPPPCALPSCFLLFSSHLLSSCQFSSLFSSHLICCLRLSSRLFLILSFILVLVLVLPLFILCHLLSSCLISHFASHLLSSLISHIVSLSTSFLSFTPHFCVPHVFRAHDHMLCITHLYMKSFMAPDCD